MLRRRPKKWCQVWSATTARWTRWDATQRTFHESGYLMSHSQVDSHLAITLWFSSPHDKTPLSTSFRSPEWCGSSAQDTFNEDAVARLLSVMQKASSEQNGIDQPCNVTMLSLPVECVALAVLQFVKNVKCLFHNRVQVICQLPTHAFVWICSV